MQVQLKFLGNSPIGHEDRREQTPDVQEHADPTGHDPHPHCSFAPADVNVLIRVYVVPLDDIPIGQKHADVHRRYGEDDVEPRVLQ